MWEEPERDRGRWKADRVEVAAAQEQQDLHSDHYRILLHHNTEAGGREIPRHCIREDRIAYCNLHRGEDIRDPVYHRRNFHRMVVVAGEDRKRRNFHTKREDRRLHVRRVPCAESIGDAHFGPWEEVEGRKTLLRFVILVESKL